MKRPIAWAVAALLLGAAAVVYHLAGAGQGSARRERFKLAHLLDEPAGDFDTRVLYTLVESSRIVFDSPEDAAGWRMGDGSPLPSVAHGIRLPPERATQRIVGRFGREAGDVAVVEVDVEQAKPSAVALLWSRPDGRLVSDNAVARLPGASGTARFELAAHPGWRGRVHTIALQPSFESQPVRVRGLRLLSHRLDAELAARAPEGPHLVVLQGDARAALAVVPGRAAATRSVAVPDGARLGFAIGLPAGASGPARFELRVAGDGTPEARVAEVAAGGTEAWSEHEVDLAAWRGRTVSFSLRAAPADATPIAFWAAPVLRWPARDARPNVLLISADTLRADHLSLYGYGRPTSPHLARWAERRGVVFESAVASSPWTLPSHVSMLTGIDAHRHGVSRQGPIPRELEVLAERFREAGYRTLATTGGGLVGARFGFARGFDVYRSRDEIPAAGDATEVERGVDEVLRWLERHAGEPLFLFLHTYATHTPFAAREPYWSRVRGRSGPRPEHPLEAIPVPPGEADGYRRSYRFMWKKPLPDGAPPVAPAPAAATAGPALDLDDPQLGVDLYDAAIALLDEQLGRLLERLRALGMEQDTIVVFTSDHGESFGENGLWSHTHLQDGNLMVPLVVAPRQRGWRSAVEQQVRLVDIAPTILELAGLPARGAIGGRSLAPLASGATRVHPKEAWAYSSRTNWGLGLRVDNRRKLIVPNAIWPALRGRNDFYDLAADPGETTSRARPGDPAYESLLGLVARELATIDRGVAVSVRCERGPCFEAVLGGLGAERDTLSSPDLACACVEPVAQGTRLRLRPGDAFTIVYEDLLDGELRIDARATGASGARRELTRRVGPGQASFSLRLEAAGWRLDEGATASPPVGLHVAYTGSVARPRPDLSREMQDRLRALGYIQ